MWCSLGLTDGPTWYTTTDPTDMLRHVLQFVLIDNLKWYTSTDLTDVQMNTCQHFARAHGADAHTLPVATSPLPLIAAPLHSSSSACLQHCLVCN